MMKMNIFLEHYKETFMIKNTLILHWTAKHGMVVALAGKIRATIQECSSKKISHTEHFRELFI